VLSEHLVEIPEKMQQINTARKAGSRLHFASVTLHWQWHLHFQVLPKPWALDALSDSVESWVDVFRLLILKSSEII